MLIKYPETVDNYNYGDLVATDLVASLERCDDDNITPFTDILQKYTGCNTDVAMAAYGEVQFQARLVSHDELVAIVEGVVIGLALMTGYADVPGKSL